MISQFWGSTVIGWHVVSNVLYCQDVARVFRPCLGHVVLCPPAVRELGRGYGISDFWVVDHKPKKIKKKIQWLNDKRKARNVPPLHMYHVIPNLLFSFFHILTLAFSCSCLGRVSPRGRSARVKFLPSLPNSDISSTTYTFVVCPPSATMRSLALSALVAVASARVFDSVPAIPKGWRFASAALATDKLSLKIGLKQTYADELEQAVLAMSSPSNPDYGKHLSREELRRYVAPTKRATDDVLSWLASYNIQPFVDNDWVTISTDVATANALLDAHFDWYENEEGGGLKLRTLSYSVPDAVAQHVDLVQPTTRFGNLGAARSTIFDMTVLEDEEVAGVDFKASATTAAAACNTTVTPACIKAQYNIGYTPPEDGNLVAFASYLEEYARYSDLTLFEQQVLPSAAGQNFSVTLINGGLNDQSSTSDSGMWKIGSFFLRCLNMTLTRETGEANLDLQYVLGVSAPIPILEYSTGGRG